MSYDVTVKLSETEIKNQAYNIQKIRKINESRAGTSKAPTAYLRTFGCQMNVHDSEKLTGLLLEMGYEITDREKEADLILYNTCCVRENAEKKVFGALGYLKHLKEDRPDFTIALCGCMMQQDVVLQELKKNHPHVDIIFGTFNLHRFPQLLHDHMETGGQIIDIWKEHLPKEATRELGLGESNEDIPAARQSKYKASVNITYGCDNYCSYCIVPYVRGRERSREAAHILSEVKTLAAEGVTEILLLGQNVNSYGKGLEAPLDFSGLLRLLNDEVPEIQRIRFMTSHPKDLSEDLILTMRDCKKVCSHLHLPFQAGSNRILEKMNRKYTKEGYLELINRIKKEIPDIAVTTDIIVGFPGEEAEDFEDTLDVVRQAGFAGAFTFLYSPRTGTPAAHMEGRVSEHQAKERFNRLADLVNSTTYDFHTAQINKVLEVLPETVSQNEPNKLTGRTDNNCLVHFTVNEGEGVDYLGKILPVKITGCKTHYLIGGAVCQNIHQ